MSVTATEPSHHPRRDPRSHPRAASAVRGQRRPDRVRSSRRRGEHHRAHATPTRSASWCRSASAGCETDIRTKLEVESRGGDGLRLDGVGDGADERVLVLRRRSATNRLQHDVWGSRSRRPDLRRVQPDRHHHAGRRWLHRQRLVELDQRLPALGLGVPRRAARRRGRRVRAAGDGADPVLPSSRSRTRGSPPACGGRQATPCTPATCSCPTTG